MRTFVRRLALVAALGACVAVSAKARTTPEAGAKTGGVARSVAYFQPLNEQE